MNRFARRTGVAFVLSAALGLASCGGGESSAADIEAKLADHNVSEASCSEVATGFSCTGSIQGEGQVQIAVTKGDNGEFTATVLSGGELVDFFVLD